MAGSEKRLKQIEVKLKSGNAGAVVGTITGLKNLKPFEGAIRLLTQLYNSSADTIIRKHIRDFMNDMKELSLRGEIMGEIRNDYKPDTVRMLVSSCWQSGLDYSSWASDFAMIFSKCDYETAIECFTVIEGFSHQITRKTKDHIISILRENPELRKSDKSALMLELVSVLS